MAETLKEFLVSLGWNVEQTKRDKDHLESAMTGAIVKAELLADIFIKMAHEVGGAVKAAAAKFENLFLSAQRMNTSVALAHDFPLLMEKYGGEAGRKASEGWLESAALKVRQNSANMTYLKDLGLGKNPITGQLEITKETILRLKELTVQSIQTIADQAGMDAQPALLMKRHADEVLSDLQGYEDYRKLLHFDIEKAGADGNTFETLVRSVGVRLGAIADKISDGLNTAITPVLDQLNAFLLAHAKEIGAAINQVMQALIMMFLSWSADFDKILKEPETTESFNKNIKLLADNIEWLAKKMASLVGYVRELLALPDVLNYLSNNTSDIDSYNRGKALVENQGSTYNTIKRTVDPTKEDIIKRMEEQHNAKPWDWKGASGRWWNNVKKAWGYGDATAPTTPSAPSEKTVIFGDSIGAGLAGAMNVDSSNAVQSKTPAWVEKQIRGYKQSLAGKDIVISSGASNDTKSAASVRAQINAAIDKGADPARITVLGVGSLASAKGNYPGASEKINATLAHEADLAGVKFQPLPFGTDVHPDYELLKKKLGGGIIAPPPATGVLNYRSELNKGFLDGDFSGEAKKLENLSGNIKPILPSTTPSWLDPDTFRKTTLGGEGGGDTNINAPSHTTIRVDGTGDPTAVAHLVQRAQKGINADLSKTLEGATP